MHLVKSGEMPDLPAPSDPIGAVHHEALCPLAALQHRAAADRTRSA